MLPAAGDDCRKHAYKPAKYIAVHESSVYFACSSCIAEFSPDRVLAGEDVSAMVTALTRENTQLGYIRRIATHFKDSIDEVVEKCSEITNDERELEGIVRRFTNGSLGPSSVLIEYVKSKYIITRLKEKCFPTDRAREDLLRLMERDCNSLRQVARLSLHEHTASSETVERHHALRNFSASQSQVVQQRHGNQQYNLPLAHQPYVERMYTLLTDSENNYAKCKKKNDEMRLELAETRSQLQNQSLRLEQESRSLVDSRRIIADYDRRIQQAGYNAQQQFDKLRGESSRAVEKLRKEANYLNAYLTRVNKYFKQKSIDYYKLQQERITIGKAEGETKKSLQNANTKIAELETTNRRLDNEVTQLSRLYQEKNRAESGLNIELQNQRNQLQTTSNQFEEKKKEAGVLSQRIAGLERELTEARGKNDMINRELNGYKLKLDNLLPNLERTTRELNALKYEKLRSDSDSTKLKEDKAKLESDKAQLAANDTQLTTDNTKLKTEITKLQQYLKVLKEKSQQQPTNPLPVPKLEIVVEEVEPMKSKFEWHTEKKPNSSKDYTNNEEYLTARTEVKPSTAKNSNEDAPKKQPNPEPHPPRQPTGPSNYTYRPPQINYERPLGRSNYYPYPYSKHHNLASSNNTSSNNITIPKITSPTPQEYGTGKRYWPQPRAQTSYTKK